MRTPLTLRRTALALGLSALLAVLPAAEAQAARGHSFAWTFEGFRGVTSRSWESTRTAPVFITRSSADPCRVPGDGESYDLHYRLTLQRKRGLRWRTVSHRHANCSTVTSSWPRMPEGRYRFQLELEPEFYNYVHTTITGRVFHSGAVPAR